MIIIENMNKHEHKPTQHSLECPLDNNHNHSCISIISPSQNIEIIDKIGDIKDKTSCYLMEFGCIFHSLVVGFCTGFINDESLIITMLISLSFHQFFEGIALGTILIKVKTFTKTKKLSLIFFYSIVTPIGIGIGFGLSTLYDTNNESYLWIEGSLNCFSSGLLLYISLFNLLGEEYTKIKNLKSISILFLSNILGLTFMAILGIWA